MLRRQWFLTKCSIFGFKLYHKALYVHLLSTKWCVINKMLAKCFRRDEQACCLGCPEKQGSAPTSMWLPGPTLTAAQGGQVEIKMG